MPPGASATWDRRSTLTLRELTLLYALISLPVIVLTQWRRARWEFLRLAGFKRFGD